MLRRGAKRAVDVLATGKAPRWWVVVLVVLSVLVVAFLAVEQPLARWQTRRWLQGLHGIQGDFLDARLSIFPLVYEVTHLKLTQPERVTKEPLLYVDDISLRLLWGSLLQGRLVARVQARGVKVVLEQPAPGTAARLPDLSTLIPVRILLDRLQAKQGEVLYVWVHQKYVPTMWFHDIEATLENLGSRPQLASQQMALAATGIVQRGGRMSVVIRAEPYAVPFTFRGEASVNGFDVSQMNTLIDSQKGVKLGPGLFSMKMTFDSEAGKLSGRVEPHLQGSAIVPHDENLGSAITALLGRVSMAISSQPDGTTTSGAILVHDELTEPDRQLLLSMEKVVENGFLLGLQESLRRAYAGQPAASRGAERRPTELQTGK